MEAITVSVPDQTLMDLARKWKDEDHVFSTFSQEVKTDAASDITPTQVMKLVAGLNEVLKDVVGMTKVGEEIANCVSPLIRNAGTAQEDDVWALFQFTPANTKVLEASDEKVMNEMSNKAEETRNKFNKKGSRFENSERTFYMMLVLVRYKPQKSLFDLYYSYVQSQNAYIWQWALSDATKEKRMTALEVESMMLLGMQLARGSNNNVQAVPNGKAFEDLKKDLEYVPTKDTTSTGCSRE